MSSKHKVRPGECISSIAYKYGFFPQTIWDHADNAGLKAERKNQNVLSPGDIVTIPDKRMKSEQCDTGQEHQFRMLNVPAKLRLTILEEDEPRANEPFVLTVDGRQIKGTTDEYGHIEVPIPPDARKAVLVVGQGEDALTMELNLGQLEPIDRIEGVQSRLTNLGYNCGGEKGTLGPVTKAAIKAFQEDHGLPSTGEPDDSFRSKLLSIHGS